MGSIASEIAIETPVAPKPTRRKAELKSLEGESSPKKPRTDKPSCDHTALLLDGASELASTDKEKLVQRLLGDVHMLSSAEDLEHAHAGHIRHFTRGSKLSKGSFVVFQPPGSIRFKIDDVTVVGTAGNFELAFSGLSDEARALVESLDDYAAQLACAEVGKTPSHVRVKLLDADGRLVTHMHPHARIIESDETVYSRENGLKGLIGRKGSAVLTLTSVCWRHSPLSEKRVAVAKVKLCELALVAKE